MKRSLMLLAAYLLLTAQAPPSALASRELRLEIRQAEDRAGKRIEALEHRVENFERNTWIVVGLCGLSLTGLIPTYVLLLRRARRLVEERLSSLIESRPRALLTMIDEREADQRLRRDTPILVIADRFETEGFLRTSGFSKVTTRDAEVKAPIDRGDVVVFDLDHGCSEEAAEEHIARNPPEAFLVYTSGVSNLRGKNGTYANSPVTLFSRLMELIKFKDALERESTRR
jgi:hypothetical protein